LTRRRDSAQPRKCARATAAPAVARLSGRHDHLPCGREKIWMTRDLVEKVPGAVTCSNYENRLKCSSCGLKG